MVFIAAVTEEIHVSKSEGQVMEIYRAILEPRLETNVNKLGQRVFQELTRL